MNDKDTFAVWVGERLLIANRDPVAAAALSTLAQQARDDGGLDDILHRASVNTRRPGDMGLEFVGPLLPILFVQFGRTLWDAYVKSLAERGGKELSALTVDSAKALLKQTLSGPDGAVTAAEVDRELRKAAENAGLNEQQVCKLLESFHSSDTMRALSDK